MRWSASCCSISPKHELTLSSFASASVFSRLAFSFSSAFLASIASFASLLPPFSILVNSLLTCLASASASPSRSTSASNSAALSLTVSSSSWTDLRVDLDAASSFLSVEVSLVVSLCARDSSVRSEVMVYSAVLSEPRSNSRETVSSETRVAWPYDNS